MYILFRFFLLFCSKDFIHFYLDLRKKGVVNPQVLSSAAFYAFLYMGIFFAACFFLYYRMMESHLQYDWTFRGWLIFVCLIIFGFCFVWIKSLEEALYAYSDGIVVVGRLISKKWSKKGFSLKYQFDADGEQLFLTKDRQSYFKAKKVSVGHELPIIYAKSSPRHAKFYNPDNFSKYCLDTTKEPPKIKVPERKYVL
ncbi:hypothetical protein [Kiloniella antarctica]|uniref:DUF5673 domain-containing protein n=1 Tax=Kiloniella antarctica TaxID=1550907 RepID=A0ABW5BK25_9PROT